ncbi:MAG: hypothetical protein E7312_04755 [Clostridiales bacterium]|nr:hypothetical protein [Clostridiales bacterium]
MKKLIGYYNYTVILTYIGFVFGLFGIVAALCWGHTTFSIVCLLLAGLCDAFDGKIASTMNRTPEEKAFGIQIDSLCDLISFGVLPAAICYAEGARGVISCIALVLYVLCGLIRLSYYNVSEIARQSNESSPRVEYSGLPITSASIIFPIAYLLSFTLFKDIQEYLHVFYTVVAFITAVLFVTPIRVKKFMTFGILVLVGVGVVCGVIILLLNF